MGESVEIFYKGKSLSTYTKEELIEIVKVSFFLQKEQADRFETERRFLRGIKRNGNG